MFEFHQLACGNWRESIGDPIHVGEFDENMVSVQLLDHRSNLTFHHLLRRKVLQRGNHIEHFHRILLNMGLDSKPACYSNAGRRRAYNHEYERPNMAMALEIG